MASNKLRSIRHLLAATVLSVSCIAAVPCHAQVSGLEIVAPTSPGGGWGQHAQDMVAVVVASDEWKETLRQRGWLDLYQPSSNFAAYLKSEQTRVKATLEDIGLVK